MANDTQITIVGNLTAEPELRVIASGAAVVNFTVASTPRYYDRKSDSWVDGEALFMTCVVWRQQAEHLTESLNKGDRVIAVGRLKQRNYDTPDGETRSRIELEVDDIGPSLRYAPATVTHATRSSAAVPADGADGSVNPPF